MKAMPDPAPVWSWTGFYIGGNGGGGWGTTETSLTSVTVPVLGTVPLGIPVAQNSRSGFLGGGQIGYNYQAGWLVIGVGADIDEKTMMQGVVPLTFSAWARAGIAREVRPSSLTEQALANLPTR